MQWVLKGSQKGSQKGSKKRLSRRRRKKEKGCEKREVDKAHAGRIACTIGDKIITYCILQR